MKRAVRKLAVVLMAAVLTAAMTIPAFADNFNQQWIYSQTEQKWWFATNRECTTWLHGSADNKTPQWVWIDANQDGNAECYAFDADGWMLQSTTTADGWTVNEDGAWTVNGEIQYNGAGTSSSFIHLGISSGGDDDSDSDESTASASNATSKFYNAVSKNTGIGYTVTKNGNYRAEITLKEARNLSVREFAGQMLNRIGHAVLNDSDEITIRGFNNGSVTMQTLYQWQTGPAFQTDGYMSIYPGTYTIRSGSYTLIIYNPQQ